MAETGFIDVYIVKKTQIDSSYQKSKNLQQRNRSSNF